MSNTSVQIGTVGLVAGLLLGVALVPTMAWADTQELVFGFSFEHGPGAPINLSAYNGNLDNPASTGEDGDGLMAIVGGEDNKFPLEILDGAQERIDSSRITTNCTTNESCTVRVSGVNVLDPSGGVRFIFGGNQNGSAPIEMYYLKNLPAYVQYIGSRDILTSNENFVIKYAESVGFNGNAYAIWGCGQWGNKVCMHLLSNVPTEEGKTEYYAASTITSSVNDTSSTFNRFGAYENEQLRGMALEGSVDKWVKQMYGDEATVSTVDWSNVAVGDLLYGTEGAAGVKLQPVGEPTGAHSYTSYGDRNFRLTIYDDTYKAVGLDLSDLHYVPDYYDPSVFADAYEISGTTQENPMTMDAVLLENIVKIKAVTAGGLNIAEVKALDVPEAAVTVTSSDGVYSLKFNSNYYDDVTFEITDTAGEKYYLRVSRSVISAEVNYREAIVRARLLFDSSTSHSDYEVTATYVYYDGRTIQKPMINEMKVDDGLGNITYAPEAEAGQNLKRASYIVEEDSGDFLDGLTGIYFNVRRAGSNEKNFAGMLTGSGYGVYLAVDSGRG